MIHELSEVDQNITTYRFVRSSLATRPQHDSVIFHKGDILRGVATFHPNNPYRKLRLHTAEGIFVINEEDVEPEEINHSEVQVQ